MTRLVLVLCALAAGCMSDVYAPKRMDVDPVPFPYPGIYSGAVRGGQMTYKMDGNGRGLSCSRATNGSMAYGDVIYTGPRIHTESWTFDVTRLTEQEMVLSWGNSYSVPEAILRKVSEAPTTCQDFFAKRPAR